MSQPQQGNQFEDNRSQLSQGNDNGAELDQPLQSQFGTDGAGATSAGSIRTGRGTPVSDIVIDGFEFDAESIYSLESDIYSYISFDSQMEVAGLALGVVGLAGPLSKAALSGYELLRATTTTAEDAGDFRLRIETEMGLLNLWIKHWVAPGTGRIRGSGEFGEEVCFLAVDILAKIGSLLVDAGKLHGKYGIQIRRGSTLSHKDSESDLAGGISRVGTTISMLTASPISPKNESVSQLSKLTIVEEDEKTGLALVTKPVASRTTSEYAPSPTTKTTTGTSNIPVLKQPDQPQMVPVPTGRRKPRKKEGRLRRFLRKAGCLRSDEPAETDDQSMSATAGPAAVPVASSQKPPQPSPIQTNQAQTAVMMDPKQSTTSVNQTSGIDVANAPVEEVFAKLDSAKAQVEANLTKVQRFKWVMIDKEKASQLANELKGWNERLFTLLPPRRLIPRSSKKNRHYTVPQRASPIFTGREMALSLLEEAFFSNDGEDDDGSIYEGDRVDRQRRAVLYGLGGAGKTQIALKFAEDNRDRFDYIFWINSSSIPTVEESFREIAELLRLPVGSSSNLTGAVKNRLAQLRDRSWLLIFDNADDISLVPYLPQGNHGCILITSRNPKVRQHLGPLDQQAYHVDEMSPDEAVALLLKAAGLGEGRSTEEQDVENKAHAIKIVEKLGYLALAIDQAGAYICNNGSIDTYLDCYENFRAELLDMREFEATGYAYPVYQTWEISFQAVTKKSPAAADVLHVCGYLNYERIPRVIFETGGLGDEAAEDSHPVVLPALKALLKSSLILDAAGKSQWKSFHFDNAIGQLNNYSLIRKNEPPTDRELSVTYTIHPLVHCWIRERKAVDQQQRLAAQTSTASLICNTILLSSGPTAYAMRSHLVAHIDVWIQPQLSTAPPTVFGSTELAQIKFFDAISIVYHEVGRLKIAQDLREKVLQWRASNLSPACHPEIIAARTALANTYRRATTELQKALELDKETVQMLCDSEEHGPDHPTTLTAKLNLGSTLSGTGDRTGCEKLEREVVESRTRLLGADHLDVAVARGDLGVTLLRLRRYPSAETELRAAYSRRLSLLGEKHPGTLLSMGNLAGALRGQSKFDEAIKLGHGVVEIRERLLGEDHQDVAKAKANYGYTLMCAGKLVEARKLEEEALSQLEAALGSYHSYVMDTLSNLSQVYLKLMDCDEGKKDSELLIKTENALVDLVERKKLVFGDEHRSTGEAAKLLNSFYEKLTKESS